MSDISTEIADAIKKNLPLQIGESLQQELAALAKYRAAGPGAKAALESLRAGRDLIAGQRDAAKAELAKHDAIDKREAAALARESKQDLRDLEVKLAELRRSDAVGLVHAIFKSPVYRETVSGMVPVALDGVPGGNGAYATPGMVSQQPTTTTTTREVG